jgi:hypothetical protein
MGKQVTLTDLEWEFVQNKVREALLNLGDYAFNLGLPSATLPATREELAQDNLGENLLARLAAATTVPEPGPVAASPGAPQAMQAEYTGDPQNSSPPPQFY